MPPLNMSPFPAGRLRYVWETVVLQYTMDPQLRAAGVTINSWSGDPDQLKEFTWDTLPGLLITPDDGNLDWTDEQRISGPWRIRLDYAVQGTNAGDLMDFAECIKSAFAWDVTRQALFITTDNQDVFLITFTTPGLKPSLVCGGQGIASTAFLTLSLNLTQVA